MLSRIRWRIAIPYVSLILAVAVVTVVYASAIVRQVTLGDLRAQLVGEGKLIGDAVAPSLGDLTGPENLDPAANRYARLVGARVTLIAPDGAVVGESHQSRLQMDNHLYRPEVQAALREGEGSSIRFSDTVGYDMMYVAVRIDRDGVPLGIARVALPLSSARAQIAQLRRTLIVGSLVATVLAAALAIAIAERIVRPVRRLTGVAERLASGDLNARLLPSGRDEVAQLTRAFNNMADQLRTQMGTLAREQSRLAAVLENAAIGIMITDAQGQVSLVNPAAARLLGTSPDKALGLSFAQAVRYHQLIELWQRCRDDQVEQSGVVEIALQDLFLQAIVKPFHEGDVPGYLILLQDLTRVRRLETVRRDFISNISHELRTPLAGLKALVDTLRDGALEDPPAAQRFLDRMEVEVDALTQMVEELLELSRIESGKIPLRLRPTPLAEVIAPTVERLRPQAERAEVALVVDLPPDAKPVLVDAERVQRVVTNLMHNAIKFTPAGGRVRVTARDPRVATEGPLPAQVRALERGSWTIVAVHDNGIGIDPDDLPRIFERFYKADRARSSGGTGLGLAIAKHIVQGHGGQIWADSPSAGPFWETGGGDAGSGERSDPRRRGSTFYLTLPVAFP
ncbi:MAG: HAMP domain-containing protein [Anaerolineae bacterium]|nr:HAMP domain-containing protein [Anaerolineae bacterium]